MLESSAIRYLGWSNIIIESSQGSLAFDPFFRPLAGAEWATVKDFSDVKVICLTHGHVEHYLDTPEVVKQTGAIVVSSKEVCDHLNSKFKVPKEKLIAVEPLQEVIVNGFKITAFNWYHRKINYFKFFMGDFFLGVNFSLSNLLKCPYAAPYYGFFVETPEGKRILNYTEGLNPLYPIEEAKELAEKFKPTIMVAGMQLTYEKDVARIVNAISPETLILYHPHKQIFDKMKIKSSPPETFVKHIKDLSPNVNIIQPEILSRVEL